MPHPIIEGEITKLLTEIVNIMPETKGSSISATIARTKVDILLDVIKDLNRIYGGEL